MVTDPEIKKQLRDAYSEYNTDFIFWMEQQREYNLRHPSYQVKNDPHGPTKTSANISIQCAKPPCGFIPLRARWRRTRKNKSSASMGFTAETLRFWVSRLAYRVSGLNTRLETRDSELSVFELCGEYFFMTNREDSE